MLLDRGIPPNSNMASKAIGYRQAMTFLQTALKQEEPVAVAQVVQLLLDIATASRNLVKNQTTYFRDEPLFHWVEASDADDAFQEVWGSVSSEIHAGERRMGGRRE